MSNQYYMDYLTISPQITYYYTSDKEVTEKGNKIYVVFATPPYVGPHDPVGEKRITFLIDHVDNIALERFDHIKGYSLLDNLKGLVKQPIPNTGD